MAPAVGAASVLAAIVNAELSHVLARRRSSEYRERVVRSGNLAALAYDGLAPTTLSVASLKKASSATGVVNLLVPRLRPDSMFAGTRTALQVGAIAANRLGLPLRIVSLNSRLTRSGARAARRVLAEPGIPNVRHLSVVSVSDLSTLSDGDRWIATHWSTAHAMDVAARVQLVSRDSVLYLIQDYEPGFVPGSTQRAVAESTYDAGFSPLVNSSPLQRYLSERHGLAIGDSVVFAPSLDRPRLRSTAEARTFRATGPLRVMFYGRPSKPRNMFDLGVASLRVLASQERTMNLEVVSVGEQHGALRLPNDLSVRTLGRVEWDEYFRLLGTADVLLSLQASPHPSHPPLDAVVSGGFAVTNDYGRSRSTLHSRLLAVNPDPDLIAGALSDALALRGGGKIQYDDDFLASLGGSMESSTLAAMSNAGWVHG